MTKVKNIFICLAITLITGYILILPNSAACGARLGLESSYSLIAYLFPYIIIATLISQSFLGDILARLLCPLTRLFRLPSGLAAPLALGLISGFPISASLASKAYLDGKCNQEQASRLIAFASNPSPAFVIGLAGGTLLKSTRTGIILYISNIAALFISGIILSLGKEKPASFNKSFSLKKPFVTLLTESITLASSSIIIICGFIVFFSFISGFVLEIFKNLPPPIASLIRGGLEMSGGIHSCKELSAPLRLPLVCLILGFCGLSALLQIISVSRNIRLNLSYYFISRLISIICLGIGAAIAVI